MICVDIPNETTVPDGISQTETQISVDEEN